MIWREKLSKKELDEKLVKMLGGLALWFPPKNVQRQCCQNWIFKQKFDFVNSVSWLYLFWPSRTVPRLLEASKRDN